MAALLLYLVVLIGTLATWWGVGDLLLRTSRLASLRRSPAATFLRLAFGAVVITVATAVVHTGGATVLIVVLLPLGWCLWAPIEPELAAESSDRSGSLCDVLAAVTFTFLLFVLRYGELGAEAGLRVPTPDLVFLTAVQRSVVATGQESIYPFATLYDPRLAGATPYHWFELWLTAPHLTLGLPPLACQLLVQPLMLTMVLSGFLTLARILGLQGRMQSWILGGLLFLPYPPPGSLGELPGVGHWAIYAFGPLEAAGGKVGTIYLFLLMSLVLFHSGHSTRARAALLMLIPASALAAPAAAFAVFASALRRDRSWISSSLRAIAAPGLILCATMLFYVLLGARLERSGAMVDILGQILSTRGLRTQLNVVGKGVLQLLLSYSVLHAVVVLGYRRVAADTSTWFTVRVLLAFVAGGLLGYAAAFREPLALELSIFTAYPGIYLLTTIVIVRYFSPRPPARSVRFAAGLLALVAGVHEVFDAAQSRRGLASGCTDYGARLTFEYLTAISHARPRTPLGGYLVGPGEIGHPWSYCLPMAAPQPLTYFVGRATAWARHLATPMPLSPLPDNLVGTSLTTQGSFLRMARPDSSSERRRSFAALQEEYVDRLRLGYLVASKGAAVPPELLRHVERAIVDRGTGERFLLLAPP